MTMLSKCLYITIVIISNDLYTKIHLQNNAFVHIPL